MNAQQKHEIYKKYHLNKNCKVCHTDNHQSMQFIFCDVCDDGYHWVCLQPPLTAQQVDQIQNWNCPQCKEHEQFLLKNKKKVQQKCYQCKQNFQKFTRHKIQVRTRDIKTNIDNQQYRKQYLYFHQYPKQCRYCQHYFHSVKCFSHRQNCLNCASCQRILRMKTPKNHYSFAKYFNQNLKKIKQHGYYELKPLQNFNEAEYKRLPNMNLRLYDYLNQWQSICRAQCSLFYCLQTNKLHYCHDQLYPSMELMAKNQSRLNIITPYQLHRQDQRIFQKYKLQNIKYNLPPLQIKQDSSKGFYVVALKFIPPNTFLCQYTGEVCTRKQGNKLHVQNDSVMSLIVAQTSAQSLDITPIKFTNISRFISGIPPKRTDLQNVQTLNFCYKGRSHVIFYSVKGIEKGETLYIDYNQGIFQQYPNQHFQA